MTPHRHLDPTRPDDLDLLADVLAGEAERPDCPTCQRALATLSAADLVVSAELAAVAALPVPEPPADLDARLNAALAGLTPDGATDVTATPVAATEVAATAAAEEPLPSTTATTTTTTTAAAAAAAASVTTLPSPDERAARTSPRRWLPAAAAAVLIAGGGTLAVLSTTDGNEAGTLAATEGSGLRDLVRNDTGTAYTPTTLAAAVPGLLAGTAPTAADQKQSADAPEAGAPGSIEQATRPATASTSPDSSTGGAASGGSVGALQAYTAADLDRLRTTDGLAGCLAALLPPDEPGQPDTAPLALDYGTFADQPAMLVLLPVPALPRKVDVFVVGASCAPEDEALLYFARVDRPAG